jgi:6-phosphogluconolactonase
VSERAVLIAPDSAALVRLAAEEVARRAESAVIARGRFTLALSGGSTPKGLYTLLADPAEPFRARIPWRQTHVFFGDERHVPPDHPDSNYGMARATLLAKVPIPPENVHRIRAERTDPAAAALEYEQELRLAFGMGGAGTGPAEARGGLGPGELPRLDLVLLGLGSDGHTASLFPGATALEERAHLVVATWVERLKTHRITLTLPLLDAARAVVFLVAGAEKAGRVADVLQGSGAALPASRVRPGGELIWLLDSAAAAALRGEREAHP